MSKINNVLTKYFRKTKRNDNKESIIQPATSTDEKENDEIEIESPSFKRLKSSEDKGSSTLASPSCSRAIECLTISTSSQPSSPTGTRALSLLTISACSLAPTTPLSSSISSATSTGLQTTIPSVPPISSPPSNSNRSPTTTALTSTANSQSFTSTCSTSTTPLVSPISSAPTTALTSRINSPSSASTCSTSTTALTSSINSPSSTSLLSSNERDPCLGPAAAKQFVFLRPYQPDFKFPTVKNRHFCGDWYSIYSWLEYSPTVDRAFCYVCRLSYGSGKIDSWFSITGFNSWKNASSRLNNHQSSVIHKQALQTWVDLKKNYNNNTDVLKLIDKQHKKQAAENRAYLVEIIRTIVFLGKQGIACKLLKYYLFCSLLFVFLYKFLIMFFVYILVRGHRERDQYSNRGNFLELLELRSLDNDLIKKNLHRLKLTDHKIQNEIIQLLQQQILTEILNECRRAKYFSVMIDETKDIACHEQVSLVIRFVDEKFNVFEKFIGFERTATMTGEALADLLIKWLKILNLNLENLVGQCYDGASNMRGEYHGVATRLRQIAPLGKA